MDIFRTLMYISGIVLLGISLLLANVGVLTGATAIWNSIWIIGMIFGMSLFIHQGADGFGLPILVLCYLVGFILNLFTSMFGELTIYTGWSVVAAGWIGLWLIKEYFRARHITTQL